MQQANALIADANWGAFFKSRPNGIRAATEVARLMETAKATEGLQTKLTEAQKEIKRLNGLVTPTGGQPPSTTPARAPGSMSQNDVMAAAAAGDREVN